MRTSLFYLIGFVAALLVLECILQLIPVNSGLRKLPTSTTSPNFRFVPDQRYVYSYGWALDNARSGKINSEGFNNSKIMQDGSQVLLVGDSYIESLMLDYPDTVQGQLDISLGGGVYAAASSGNGLADSLQLVREFVPKIHPKSVIIFIEAQDVSTLLDTASRGHSYFQIQDGHVSVAHTPYQESKAKQMLMHSALVRYVFYSLKFPDWVSGKLSTLRAASKHSGKDEPDLKSSRNKYAKYYFDEIKKLSEKYNFRPIFLVDADHQRIYKDSKQNIGWQSGDREWILQNIAEGEFAVVDLHPSFNEFWKLRREKFDFLPMDGHWNQAGHGIAARELLRILPAYR